MGKRVGNESDMSVSLKLALVVDKVRLCKKLGR
jgi:hypothetical protein